MTRRLRSLNGGRLRVWWIHHRQEARHHALFAILVGLWLLANHLDYQDQIDYERAMRAEAEQQLQSDRALRGLPNPAIVLDAKTAERFGLRLAEIAGGLDAERAKVRGSK